MKLQYSNLAPGVVGSQAKLSKLSPRALNAISEVTGNARASIPDFLTWVRSLRGTTMRHELKKLMNVGDGTVDELVELAVSEGMVRADIDLAHDIGKNAYSALQRITGKIHPLKEDFRGVIASLPPGTDVRRALLSDVRQVTAERLIKFAVREGFTGSETPPAQKI